MKKLLEGLAKTNSLVCVGLGEFGADIETDKLFSDMTIRMDVKYKNPNSFNYACDYIARVFYKNGKIDDIQTVIAPEPEGCVLLRLVSFHLFGERNMAAIVSVRSNTNEGSDNFFLKKEDARDYVHGKKVLALFDATQAKGSLAEFLGVIQDAGGEIIGLAIVTAQ